MQVEQLLHIIGLFIIGLGSIGTMIACFVHILTIRLCIKKTEKTEKSFLEALGHIRENAEVDRLRTDSHLKANLDLFKDKLENHNKVMQTFNITFIELLSIISSTKEIIKETKPILERLERKI